MFNDFPHHHGDTETREAFISSLLSFSPFFFFPPLSHSDIPPRCLRRPGSPVIFLFAVSQALSGAVVQAAYASKGAGSFVAREHRESLRCSCNRNRGEMYRQRIPSLKDLSSPGAAARLLGRARAGGAALRFTHSPVLRSSPGFTARWCCVSHQRWGLNSQTFQSKSKSRHSLR